MPHERKAKPEGPYTLWWQTDGFWAFHDYATLREALDGVNDHAFGSGWSIQKVVYYEVIETQTAAPKEAGYDPSFAEAERRISGSPDVWRG